MDRRIAIPALLCLLLLSCNQPIEHTVPDRPHILLIVADDMGYADLACYGGLSQTPNLNKLAENGVRFTDFYAAAPNCSPSRAGLMTGKSPAKVGMYSYRPPNHPMHLRESEQTLVEVLQQQQYQTAHVGKWHLGCLPQDSVLNHPQPVDQGFSYSLGTENNAQPSHLNPTNFVRNGKALDQQAGYSCQLLADEAITWWDNHYKSEDPFFMYVAFHEPHVKVASPPELVGKYADFPDRDAKYLANIENLDLAVGRIIAYLTGKQLLDNTLIIFSSDNGSYRQASNGDLRAVKSYVYEGGIRVPGIIHWPALKQKGQLIHEPAGFVDILPTICDILDIQPDNSAEWDGTSMLSLLKNEPFERKKPLYWYFYRTTPEIAMRVDNLMVLGKDQDTISLSHQFSAPDMAYIQQMNLDAYELYDLSVDIGQSHNLIETDDRAERYTGMLDEQLEAIQINGHHWDDLPPPNKKRKRKSDWVKYERK